MSRELDKWCGKFGNNYTQRNFPKGEIVTQRRKAFETIIPSDALTILEVGCNAGLNLASLESGRRVFGVEPNEIARRLADMAGFKVYSDSGYDLKFLDNSFDLLMTCGVLIHIPQHYISHILGEIKRVSCKYCLFMEYFSEKDEEINYRGESGLLWKRNWPKWFESYSWKPFRRGFAGPDQGFDNLHWWLYKKIEGEN